MEIRDIGPGLGDYVVVGKVIKAHGIKGEIKVFPNSGHPEDFKFYKEVRLCDTSSAGHGPDDETCRGGMQAIVKSSGQGKIVILALKNVSGRDEAEALRGLEVLVPKEKLPELGADQYYWHELDGLRVRTDEGREIGRVTALMTTAAHHILIVTNKGREYMIPAEKEFVTEVDRQKGIMTITPPPGLLEMND